MLLCSFKMRQLETEIAPLCTKNFKSFCIIVNNTKNPIVVSNESTGKRNYSFDGKRSLTCHAEMNGVKKYFRLKGDLAKKSLRKTKIISLRARMEDDKIIFKNSKPCVRCFLTLTKTFGFRRIYYLDENLHYHCVNGMCDKNLFNLSSADRWTSFHLI